jgi:hypothetical protein
MAENAGPDASNLASSSEPNLSCEISSKPPEPKDRVSPYRSEFVNGFETAVVRIL